MREIKLRSSICSIKISPIDFKKIKNAFPNQTKYNIYLNRVLNLVLQDKTNGCKFVIYKGGKVRCMGINSFKKIENVAKIFSDLLKLKKIKIKIIENPVIENLVATFNLNTKLNLNSVAKILNAEFNPETFPAVIFRYESTKYKKGTALIFGSGKIVLTGFKTYNNLKEATKLIETLLRGKKCLN